MTILKILKDRGIIEETTEGLKEAVESGKQLTIYNGYDPTGDSLHVGHLLPAFAMAHFQKAGHIPIILIGGATAKVGDPSGKSEARPMLKAQEIAQNAKFLKKQFKRFFNFDGENGAVMVDNSNWIESINILDYLREVGAHFNIKTMLAKASVKQRLETEQGLSLLEFSYQTLQAFDFLELNKRFGCTVQLGGNDQLGNITAGIDFVRKKTGKKVHGLTVPLLTKSNGEKFGKTAGEAVWLDPAKTSPFQFYQFWLQTSDDDVEKFLKFFTFMELDEIANIMKEHCQSPERRIAQKMLAAEVTILVHGKTETGRAIQTSELLFGGKLNKMSSFQIRDAFRDAPTTTVSIKDLREGLGIVELLTSTSMSTSKGQARRLIKQGGVQLNNKKVQSSDFIVTSNELLSGEFLLLGVGKRKRHLVQVI